MPATRDSCPNFSWIGSPYPSVLLGRACPVPASPPPHPAAAAREAAKLHGMEARETPELLLLLLTPTRRYPRPKTTSRSVARRCAKHITCIAMTLEKNGNETEARWFRSLPAKLVHEQKPGHHPLPRDQPRLPGNLQRCTWGGGGGEGRGMGRTATG